jgi:hypothetical protein
MSVPPNVSIKMVAMPVVYTNNAGGGDNEYNARQGTSKTYFIAVEGGTVLEAWYCPMDNIPDLSAIPNIVCSPVGGNVALTVGAPGGARNARVRIRIYAVVRA